MALVVEEAVCGNHLETGYGADGTELNQFQWHRVWLKMLGLKTYDPIRLWITKIWRDGLIASNLFTFVQNKWITGPTHKLT